MTQDRVKGFVVGSDRNEKGETVWKVRVKDDCLLAGRKLLVVSVRDNAALASGVDVDFIVQYAHGCSKGAYPYAVDTRVLTMDQQAEVRSTRTGSQTKPNMEGTNMPETINLCVSEMDGRLDVYTTGHASIEEAKRDFEGSGERVVAFAALTQDDLGDEHEYGAAFELIRAMTLTDDVRESLEKFMTRIFLLGVAHGRKQTR